MGTPILVPCLVHLRTQFNTIAPNRDKGADGWIGDKAHQQESSDHNPDETGRTPYEDADNINEVHALDVDRDLGEDEYGQVLELADYVDEMYENHYQGHDDRLQNIIYRGLVASRSWGWTRWHTYTGASKHFDHAHFSARYTTTQENDTKDFFTMPITPAEFKKIAEMTADELEKRLALSKLGARTVGGTLNALADWGVQDHPETAKDAK